MQKPSPSPSGSEDWKPLSVELPARYWIVVLGAIEAFREGHLTPLIKRHKGKDPKTGGIPDAEKAIIAGTLSSRAEIVTALVKAGVMKPEAEKDFGTTFLQQLRDIGRINLEGKERGEN